MASRQVGALQVFPNHSNLTFSGDMNLQPKLEKRHPSPQENWSLSWRFVIPDRGSRCAVAEWLPFKVSRTIGLVAWIRKILGLRQLARSNEIREISQRDFERYWKEANSDLRSESGLWDEEKEIIFIKLTNPPRAESL